MNPLEQNLKKLAEDLELPPFGEKDNLSCYQVSLSPDLNITLKDLKNRFALFANVAPSPSQKKEEAYIYFMKANLLGQGTGDQILSLDPEEKFLTLSCIIPYDINYNEFKEKIEDFVNYLDYWQAEVKKIEKAESESIL